MKISQSDTNVSEMIEFETQKILIYLRVKLTKVDMVYESL